MGLNIPCFFMLCTENTEQACLDKGLLGDREWFLRELKSIKKGDIGFLLNVQSDRLFGPFVAESSGQLNIDPSAWGGKFPAQIKVKPLSSLKPIDRASEKLEKIVPLRVFKSGPNQIPARKTYGPEVTEKVLALFGQLDQIDHLPIQVEQLGIVPEFTLADVAGLDEVKNFIYQRIVAPFENEERAYSLGLRIGGGILLFGPPGTGKTLIAMSIAKNIQGKFIDISPSVIVGFPGEAEKRLESIFSALEKEPRAVVLLDEAEWILSKRGEQTSSVMQRITPVLLAQLSRIFKQRTKPLIVVAATNKPELIDPAFLRPGRFDKPFYVGLPDGAAIKDIMRLQLRNRTHELRDGDIAELAERLSGYSGADIENIIEEAAFVAFGRKSDKPAITKDDVLKAVGRAAKSVSEDDVEKHKRWAKERGLMI